MPLTGDRREKTIFFGALAALVAASVAIRLPLVILRVPFFDELFTLWIGRKPFGAIVEALRLDSGPPLYYFLVHALGLSGDLTAARTLSLVAGAAAVAVAFLVADALEVRIIAALFVALWPVHVYFSSEARSYALCALFVGVACVALDGWSEKGATRYLVLAAAALVLAAYSHFYGALAFPLLVAIPLIEKRKREVVHGIYATVGAAISFLPGFLLAAQQPPAAMQWLRPLAAAEAAVSVVRQLQFATPGGMMPAAPLLLQVVSMAAVLSVVIAGAIQSDRARRWLWMTLVPVAALFAATLVRRIYFPARFESILAVPFALLLATSLRSFRREWLRAAVAVVLAVVSAVMWAVASGGFAKENAGPYRGVATYVTNKVDAKQPIVVSGLSYLEVVTQADSAGARRITALPAEQALHPGWRAVVDPRTLEVEAAALARAHREVVWVGEQGSAEERALARHFDLRLRYRDFPLVVLSGSEHRMKQLQ